MENSGESNEAPLQALLRDLKDDIVSDLGLTLFRYVWRWEETADPYWIDLAIVETGKNGYRLPPSLQNLATHTASLRLMGSERKGRAPKALKEEIKLRAFMLMASLIAADQNGEPIFEEGKKLGVISAAAAHAANAMAQQFGRQYYTASVLEKFYKQQCKSPMPWLEELVQTEIFERHPEALALLNGELAKLRRLQRGNRH
ncbi:MAG: hypothetical protein ACKOXK_05855 [Chakrabartia sp.]